MFRSILTAVGAYSLIVLSHSSLAFGGETAPGWCPSRTVKPAWINYKAGAKIKVVFYEANSPKDRPPKNNSALRPGDIVLRVGDALITDKEQFAKLLADASGKKMRLTILDPTTSLPFRADVDLTDIKVKFGMRYDIVPVEHRAYQYFLSRPSK